MANKAVELIDLWQYITLIMCRCHRLLGYERFPFLIFAVKGNLKRIPNNHAIAIDCFNHMSKIKKIFHQYSMYRLCLVGHTWVFLRIGIIKDIFTKNKKYPFVLRAPKFDNRLHDCVCGVNCRHGTISAILQLWPSSPP